jgi:hypothetical protein
MLLFGLIGLITLVCAPFALMGLDAALVASGVYDDEAVALLPDKIHSIAIRRRPIWHPLLANEFYRSIVLLRAGKAVIQSEIDADTGGYAMIQTFDMNDGNLLMTDGLSCYQVGLDQREINLVLVADRAKLRFLGTFDEDKKNHRSFRFFDAQERPQKSFGYNAPKWCMES